MITIDMVKSVELISSDIQVVQIDAGRSNGLLHFTHEVTITMVDGKFDHADVVSPGGWITFTNDKEDADYLEQSYPGAIDIAKKAIEDAYTEAYTTINKLMEDN